MANRVEFLTNFIRMKLGGVTAIVTVMEDLDLQTVVITVSNTDTYTFTQLNEIGKFNVTPIIANTRTERIYEMYIVPAPFFQLIIKFYINSANPQFIGTSNFDVHDTSILARVTEGNFRHNSPLLRVRPVDEMSLDLFVGTLYQVAGRQYNSYCQVDSVNGGEWYTISLLGYNRIDFDAMLRIFRHCPARIPPNEFRVTMADNTFAINIKYMSDNYNPATVINAIAMNRTEVIHRKRIRLTQDD